MVNKNSKGPQFEICSPPRKRFIYIFVVTLCCHLTSIPTYLWNAAIYYLMTRNKIIVSVGEYV